MTTKNDPPHPRVVCVRYDEDGPSAPEVLAKGRGELAERILKVAAAHDIPVREDADLVELLSACEVGAEIPAELYAAVAEILAYLYRLNGALSVGAASPGVGGAGPDGVSAQD